MTPLQFSEWVALGSLVLAAITMLTARRKDSNEDASFKATMCAKLDAANSSLVDVKSEIKVSQKQQSEMNERIAQCECIAKSAHDKADKLEQMFHQAHPPV